MLSRQPTLAWLIREVSMIFQRPEHADAVAHRPDGTVRPLATEFDPLVVGHDPPGGRIAGGREAQRIGIRHRRCDRPIRDRRFAAHGIQYRLTHGGGVQISSTHAFHGGAAIFAALKVLLDRVCLLLAQCAVLERSELFGTGVSSRLLHSLPPYKSSVSSASVSLSRRITRLFDT